MSTLKPAKPDLDGQSLRLSRRWLLQSAPFCLLAPAALAQAPAALGQAPAALGQEPAPIAVSKIHSFSIRVRDVQRSLEFYQGVFGAPVQARQGDTLCLRIGSGPRFFSIAPVRAGEEPGFKAIGLSVSDFDPGRTRQALAAHGISPADAPATGQSPLDKAMNSWVVSREQAGGGTAVQELYFADAEGVVYHLTAEEYCGGSGSRGEVCTAVEPAPDSGLFSLVDLSHFTNFVANRDRANAFITRTFGKSFQAYQGQDSPVIGVGDGLQFLMYVGGSEGGRPENPGRIDHVCFSIEDFDVDAVLAQLTDYGLSARQDAGNTGPLMHWISMRMPNRGGAEGGTPELYFTDPDGIRVQLQDPGYCGGGGYLGDNCPPL